MMREQIALRTFYLSRKMFGGILSRLFAIKCALTVYPFSIIILFALSFTIVLGYMIRIIEYNPYYIITDGKEVEKEPSKNFLYLGNSLWYILITMTTGIIFSNIVGYGDYYPETNLGRFIGITAAIIGTTIVSILIISLQSNLTPSKIETQVS